MGRYKEPDQINLRGQGSSPVQTRIFQAFLSLLRIMFPSILLLHCLEDNKIFGSEN